MTWKLKRTRQCQKCPWRVDVDPREIPNGYDEDKHRALAGTIAKPDDPLANLMGALSGDPQHTMACHEQHDAHCVGWLFNQAGPGNNIALRLQLLSCENRDRLRTFGKQHQRFEDTLP